MRLEEIILRLGREELRIILFMNMKG